MWFYGESVWRLPLLTGVRVSSLLVLLRIVGVARARRVKLLFDFIKLCDEAHLRVKALQIGPILPSASIGVLLAQGWSRKLALPSMRLWGDAP